MLLLLASIGCRPAVTADPSKTAPADDSAYTPSESPPESPPWDSAVEVVPGTGAPDTGEAPEQEDRDCGSLYDPDEVQNFEIEVSDDDWAALQQDYSRGEKNYHDVVFRWGDEVVDDAMIRLKGNPSFSWFTEKMQFVIAFNQHNPDGRFHGVRKISLDAAWYEPTLLRDRIAWSILRRQGEVPAACANSATLTINGAYYGLYTNIEYLDHEWLERVFGDADATGTLYKYGTDPVSNEEAATGAVERVWSTTNPTTLEGLGDLYEWELSWAAEIVVGDDDGYWCCAHNFYLYEHPTRGVLFVPWDLDDNFDVQPYDTDPINGYYDGLFNQSHLLTLASDPSWGPRFLDAVASVNAAMDPDLVEADIDAADAQIRDLLEADPTRSIGLEEHDQAVARMRHWVRARHAYLEGWVACQRGETADGDGDGVGVCDDPDDGDPSIYPGAPETCNGRDDDANGVVDDADGCDDCARHDLEDSHFLYCRTPRTQADAQARCAESGGELDLYATTGEYYMYFFYTWPVFESWWAGDATAGGRCATWEVSSWSSGAAPCTQEHPSICRIP